MPSLGKGRCSLTRKKELCSICEQAPARPEGRGLQAVAGGLISRILRAKTPLELWPVRNQSPRRSSWRLSTGPIRSDPPSQRLPDGALDALREG
jgi:hypothetical protein